MAQDHELHVAIRALMAIEAINSTDIGSGVSEHAIEDELLCRWLGLSENRPRRSWDINPVVSAYVTGMCSWRWSSERIRSAGIKPVLLAQIGSASIDGIEFLKIMSRVSIQEIVPEVISQVALLYPGYEIQLASVAERCKSEGDYLAALAASELFESVRDATNSHTTSPIADALWMSIHLATEIPHQSLSGGYVDEILKVARALAGAVSYAASVAPSSGGGDQMFWGTVGRTVSVLQKLGSPGTTYLHFLNPDPPELRFGHTPIPCDQGVIRDAWPEISEVVVKSPEE